MLKDVGKSRNTRNFFKTSNCLNYLNYELWFFSIFAILKKTYLSQMVKYPVGKRYCQQFWSSSVWKTFSLCFSEEMWPCHCFSLLQFFPHIQQWKSTCFTRNLKTKHWEMQCCKHRNSPNTFWMFSLCWPAEYRLPKQLFKQSYKVYDLHWL